MQHVVYCMYEHDDGRAGSKIYIELDRDRRHARCIMQVPPRNGQHYLRHDNAHLQVFRLVEPGRRYSTYGLAWTLGSSASQPNREETRPDETRRASEQANERAKGSGLWCMVVRGTWYVVGGGWWVRGGCTKRSKRDGTFAIHVDRR